jgi:hypothetical protein
MPKEKKQTKKQVEKNTPQNKFSNFSQPKKVKHEEVKQEGNGVFNLFLDGTKNVVKTVTGVFVENKQEVSNKEEFIAEHYKIYWDEESLEETKPVWLALIAKCIRNALDSVEEIAKEEELMSQKQKLIDWLKSNLVEVHTKNFLSNEITLEMIEWLDSDDFTIKNELKKEAAERIMPVAIERFKEIIEKQLEFEAKEFIFKAIGFLAPLLKENLYYNEIVKQLEKGFEDKCVDKNLLKIFVFVAKLSPETLLISLRQSGTIKEILQKFQELSIEISKKEAIEKKAESYRKMKENRDNNSKFPFFEHLERAISENDDASLKEIIKALVCLKNSFRDVWTIIEQLGLKCDKSLLSSHYLLSSIETIEENKWAKDKDCYVVLGNMGVGKSTFIHFLQDNVKPHFVTFSDWWTLKQKQFRCPEIRTKLVDAKTIIPWKNEIELDKKTVYMYDTPGFHITDSYEQEITSALALK